MVNVVENVISKGEQDLLEKTFLSCDFPWFLNYETGVGKDQAGDNNYYDSDCVFDSFQFTHCFVRDGVINSGSFGILTNLYNNLAIKENIHTFNMDRVKANLTMPQIAFKKGMYKPPHTDVLKSNCITAIYYVNDADGDTLFFDKQEKMQTSRDFTISKRITPKKGSLIYFPANLVHSSEYPISSHMRCVINFNFIQGV